MYFDDPSSISDNSNKFQAVPRKNIAKVLDDFESKKYHDKTTTVTNFLNIIFTFHFNFSSQDH